MPVISDMKEREPVNKISDQKNNHCPFQDLSYHRTLAHRFEFLHGKAHGIPDGKQERWKNQVGWRKAVPRGMLKLGKGYSHRAIDNDHETDGHSPENVQGQRSGIGWLSHPEIYNISFNSTF
jgi:hypothetical protein